jgi:hypothetical protein
MTHHASEAHTPMMKRRILPTGLPPLGPPLSERLLVEREPETGPEEIIAVIRTNGIKAPAQILDLTCTGCLIICETASMKAGSRLTIKISVLDYLSAVVRWAEGHKAGIEFLYGLDQAVVDHIKRNRPDIEVRGESKTGVLRF